MAEIEDGSDGRPGRCCQQSSTSTTRRRFRMQFTDAAQEAAYRHVGGLLSQLFGESARPDPRGPVFWLTYGSAEIGIGVEALPGERVYARVFSWVVTGPRVDADLTHFLLRANRD